VSGTPTFFINGIRHGHPCQLDDHFGLADGVPCHRLVSPVVSRVVNRHLLAHRLSLVPAAFVSVLLHELAHSLVACRRGLPVTSITLFIFGGVSNIEREPTSPGVEFQMAVVGPLTSLVIGIVCFLLQVPLRGSNSPLEGILFYLAMTNVLLGFFNLIPGFPLDGGRVLRSIVWRLTGSKRQATRVASLTGQFIAYLFILLGILIFFAGSILDGIWLGFIGWFAVSRRPVRQRARHADVRLACREGGWVRS
jgi:Zn-dependent protease